jgi:hypothetical protein
MTLTRQPFDPFAFVFYAVPLVAWGVMADRPDYAAIAFSGYALAWLVRWLRVPPQEESHADASQ